MPHSLSILYMQKDPFPHTALKQLIKRYQTKTNKTTLFYDTLNKIRKDSMALLLGPNHNVLHE